MESYVKEKIQGVSVSHWREAMVGKSTLEIYRNRVDLKLPSYWEVSPEASLLCRARIGDLATLSLLKKEGEVDICLMCANNEEETTRHVLWVCPAYERARSTLYRTIGWNIGGHITPHVTGIAWILGLTWEPNQMHWDALGSFIRSVWTYRREVMGNSTLRQGKGRGSR